jgi:hypothetical protein
VSALPTHGAEHRALPAKISLSSGTFNKFLPAAIGIETPLTPLEISLIGHSVSLHAEGCFNGSVKIEKECAHWKKMHFTGVLNVTESAGVVPTRNGMPMQILPVKGKREATPLTFMAIC